MTTINELITRYPQLAPCEADILKAYELLLDCYRHGGKVLVCGNGGSASDSEHIVGELLKKFKRHRGIPASVATALQAQGAGELVPKLEGSLPAISLVSMTGILTAFANDVSWETAFAQQALGLAKPGDVLIALSTSGNSANCVAASQVMKAVGGHSVALTGMGGGKLGGVCDATIAVPERETYKIQELHLPIYHALCAALEDALFT